MNTLNDRIRIIRKSFELSQKEFADKIGASQRSVSWGEQPGNNVQDVTIKAICKTFSINEDWLRYGKEPMKVQPPVFSLDDFVKSKGATGLELEIIKAYFDIDPDTRKMLMDHFKERLSAYSGELLREEVPSDSEEFEAQYPPIPDNQSEVG